MVSGGGVIGERELLSGGRSCKLHILMGGRLSVVEVVKGSWCNSGVSRGTLSVEEVVRGSWSNSGVMGSRLCMWRAPAPDHQRPATTLSESKRGIYYFAEVEEFSGLSNIHQVH